MKIAMRVLLTGALFLISVCVYGQGLTKQFQKWDDFQGELVSRARERIGISNDFDIRITDVAAPVGTLFRIGGSIQIDASKCTMLTPNKNDLPSLYPQYSLDRSIGFNLGLNEGVIGQLSSFGVKFGHAKNIGFRVDDPAMRQLTDSDMQSLLKNEACAAVIPNSGAMLVRGYISGKRAITLGTSRNGELNAGMKSVGNLTFTANGKHSIQAIDTSDRDFIQILAFVQPIEEKGKEALTIRSVADVVSPTTKGMIFLQRDSRDATQQSLQLRASIANKGYSVATGIEAIAQDKMPDISQVRYFNDSDRESANAILALLRQSRPNAELKKLGLRAPPGQIEVWLTLD